MQKLGSEKKFATESVFNTPFLASMVLDLPVRPHILYRRECLFPLVWVVLLGEALPALDTATRWWADSSLSTSLCNQTWYLNLSQKCQQFPSGLLSKYCRAWCCSTFEWELEFIQCGLFSRRRECLTIVWPILYFRIWPTSKIQVDWSTKTYFQRWLFQLHLTKVSLTR